MADPFIDETEVREAAYYIWIEAGQPVGQDQDHWNKALQALKSRPSVAKKAAKKPRAASAKAPEKTKAAVKKPATRRGVKARA